MKNPPEKQSIYAKTYRERHPEKRHEAYLKNKDKVAAQSKAMYLSLSPEQKQIRNWTSKLSRYGITQADYDRMFTAQEGRCAICGRHQSELPKPLYVDHNHKTLKVRKLLCQKCNSMLGFARENIEILLVAIGYLKEDKPE